MTRNRIALAAALFAAVAVPAHASFEFDLGPARGLFEVRVSAGVAVRTQDPGEDYLGIANGGRAFSTNFDDPNKAFNRAGEAFTAPTKILTDLTLSHGSFVFFARGGFGADLVNLDGKLFRESDYGPGREADLDELRAKERAVRGEIGRYAEVLDLHLSQNTELLGRPFGWRVGRQILNWGESTFIPNGLNAILAANANRAGVPGAELEEVFIPANKVWASWDLNKTVRVEGFYQLEWERTIPFVAGSFFSVSDLVGIGATRTNLGFGRVTENSPAGTPCAAPPFPNNPCVPFGSTVPRLADNTPSNSGQYGGAVHFFTPALGGTSIGLYGANYHSRLPLLSGVSRTDGTASTQTSGYLIEYPEDIQMVGVSFSTQGPFGSNLQGEYSYKVDQPLQLDDVELLLAGLGGPNQITGNVPFPVSLGNQYIRGWRRHDVSNVNSSITFLFQPDTLPGSDALVVIVEAGAIVAHGLPPSAELRYEAPGTPLPGNPAVAAGQGLPVEPGEFASRSSWGYRVVSVATYNNVFGRFVMRPSLRFDHDVNGITPLPLGNYVQGRKQIQSAVAFEYNNQWQFDLGYTVFTGGGRQNLLRDRDFIQTAIRYAF
jgi:hypothetical protein